MTTQIAQIEALPGIAEVRYPKPGSFELAGKHAWPWQTAWDSVLDQKVSKGKHRATGRHADYFEPSWTHPSYRNHVGRHAGKRELLPHVSDAITRAEAYDIICPACSADRGQACEGYDEDAVLCDERLEAVA